MSLAIPDRFAGSVVFVTGAAHGIGRATAQRFLAEGARVVLADVDPEAAGHVAAGHDPDRALVVACDQTSTASVTAAFQEALRWAGGLDVLANVAGGAEPDPPIEEMGDEQWAHELDLNLTGVMRCIRAAVPHLHDDGAIVTVSSINALAAFGSEPYSAAKAGLSALTRNLAIQLAPRGIRVNVVAPGTVRTRVWEGQPGGADRNLPLIPLGRPGEPEDIAAAVTFLASADASWVTGITMPVDGGMLAGPRQVTSTPMWRAHLESIAGDGAGDGARETTAGQASDGDSAGDDPTPRALP
ncbi:MAG TPA: SDR family NAD(P)-dependent oxidoreductase [Beutenbergiaceae bacterium]|nr:SDR family NAD(P)-dependent oxidoreductase [Beutenbergiaceae bacterium]